MVDSASCTYNCHGYAWHVSEDIYAPKCWVTSENVVNCYIGDGSYEMTTEEHAEKVVYFTGARTDYPFHSAIKSTTHSGMFESKFTDGPLFRHPLRVCSFYDASIKYYRMPCRTQYKNRTISVNLTITGCDTLVIQEVAIMDSTVLVTANKIVILQSGFSAEIGSDVTISVGNNTAAVVPLFYGTGENQSESAQPVSSVCKNNTFENITIFPNPTTGELRITSERANKWTGEQVNKWTGERANEWTGEQVNEWTGEQVNKWTSERANEIEVYDIYGKKVGAKFPSNKLEGWQPQADGVVINISHLQAGIYFVKIETENGAVTKKIIKY
jgi:hypothetical protein